MEAQRAAQLLVLLAHLYEKQRGKKITRMRVGRNVLLKCLGRKRSLPPSMIACLQDELAELGWTLIEIDLLEFALMHTPIVNSWVKLSYRLLEENGFLSKGAIEIDNLFTDCGLRVELASSVQDTED